MWQHTPAPLVEQSVKGNGATTMKWMWYDHSQTLWEAVENYGSQGSNVYDAQWPSRVAGKKGMKEYHKATCHNSGCTKRKVSEVKSSTLHLVRLEINNYGNRSKISYPVPAAVQ
jgi:hypothetical protein